MGIGLVALVAPEAAERILAESDSVYRIGVVVDGEGVEHGDYDHTGLADRVFSARVS
ncbi:hypothetical protein KSP40_PGU016009 [Platanthera guangdongensis]|uniref:Uncharacterized protein n=1 Tax=Platanthera guangdongensis TaxID=2320717 RepID=A0ABR2MZX5_9ASPA